MSVQSANPESRSRTGNHAGSPGNKKSYFSLIRRPVPILINFGILYSDIVSL